MKKKKQQQDIKVQTNSSKIQFNHSTLSPNNSYRKKERHLRNLQ